MRTASFLAALVALAAMLLAGCAAPASGTAPTGEKRGDGTPLAGELTVFAAASLQAAFDEIALSFETANPEVDILPIVYDGSGTLATQLAEGASADIFASADEASMARLPELAPEPVLFAANTLVVAMPEGNPGGVDALDDLADPSRTVVLCAEQVPCGAASAALLEGAGLDVRAASYEQNVTAVLTRVRANEADAGLVYATDVVGQAVESFTPRGAAAVVNRYPIAALAGSGNPAAADAFVDYVTSDAGAAVLQRRGFGAP